MFNWSRNKHLTVLWLLFMLDFIASAVVLGVVSAVWRSEDTSVLDQNTLRRLTISDSALTATMVLAGAIMVSASIGGWGFWKGWSKGNGEKTLGLVLFNWSLFVTSLVTVTIGTIIWFYTLTERNAFMTIWRAQDVATQSFIQDALSCCGYWNATSSGLFVSASGFCGNLSPANLAATTPCVGPVTDFADNLLNNVFTTIYAFTGIQVGLFMTTACLIISRREEERFRTIDEKRGTKGGFV